MLSCSKLFIHEGKVGTMTLIPDTDVLHCVVQRVYKMNIAICDDDEYFRILLKEAVYTYTNAYRLKFSIDEYSCGEDLLNSNKKYNMIFLDYKMGGMNGLDTARALRKNNLNCIIIFMTNFPHFVYESFEVSAYRFFTKPLDISKLHKTFDDYFNTYGNDYPILLKVERSTICLQTRDIIYLEADNKKCYINLDNEKYHCAKTMAAVFALLPASIFYKVHKSFVVNFNYVSSYDSQTIHFKNGATAHIGRKHLTQFKDAYRTFAKARAI